MKLSSASLIKFNSSNTDTIYGLYTKFATKCNVCALVTLSNIGVYRKFFESGLAKQYIVFDENFYAIKSLCKQYKNVEFVEINTENLISKIEGKNMKFDLIIGNPPYGERGMGSHDLHFEIAEKMFNLYKNKMIFIMPNRIGISTSEKFNVWKEKFSNVSIITDEGNPFEHVSVNVGIFVFENYKVKNINVFGKDYKNLFEISNFTSYELSFMNKLKSDFSKKHFMMTNTNYENKLKKFAFACTYNNGAKFGCGIYFSSITNDLKIMNKNDFIKWNKNYENGQKCCITDNSKIYCENLKNAMKRPLLRFGLYKMQDDRHLTSRCYQYIPDIDWSDNKTLTDEGILEMCGCTNKEAKEFAKYCSDYIEKIDKKDND
jgi:hypothetical protein